MSRLPTSYPAGTGQEDMQELEIKPNPWQVNRAQNRPPPNVSVVLWQVFRNSLESPFPCAAALYGKIFHSFKKAQAMIRDIKGLLKLKLMAW